MNYVLSILNADGLNTMLGILKDLALPPSLVLHGRGTADKSMMNLLRLSAREKRVVCTVANEEKTEKLIFEAKRKLYIDAPGNGVIVAVPVKSVGGAKTLAYLTNGEKTGPALGKEFESELIIAIANEGHTESVMAAARLAGAAGGTVVHGKGTGSKGDEKFYQVSIAAEKEMILIVAKSGNKAEIMRSILQHAGPETEAGAIVFSLPVVNTGGFMLL